MHSLIILDLLAHNFKDVESSVVSPFRLLKSCAHYGLGQTGRAANVCKGVDKRAAGKKRMSRSFLQMLSTSNSQVLGIIDHKVIPKEFVGFVLSWDLRKPQASLNLLPS